MYRAAHEVTEWWLKGIDFLDGLARESRAIWSPQAKFPVINKFSPVPGLPQTLNKEVEIALHLRGEGKFSIYEFGVAAALVRAGIGISLITGTSLGAGAGAATACALVIHGTGGEAASMIEDIARGFIHLFDQVQHEPPILSAWYFANSFGKFLESALPRFQELIEDERAPAFAVNALRVGNDSDTLFHNMGTGKMALECVLASAALDRNGGVFDPVCIENTGKEEWHDHFVDAGAHENASNPPLQDAHELFLDKFGAPPDQAVIVVVHPDMIQANSKGIKGYSALDELERGHWDRIADFGNKEFCSTHTHFAELPKGLTRSAAISAPRPVLEDLLNAGLAAGKELAVTIRETHAKRLSLARIRTCDLYAA